MRDDALGKGGTRRTCLGAVTGELPGDIVGDMQLAARSLAGSLRVSSTRALALSFSGSLPQTSAISFTLFVSTWPVPLAVPPLVSRCGLLDRSVPGELPG